MRIFSTYNFHPYGMLMPNRHAQQASGDYRYGFQGQEGDDEIKGSNNSVNYEYRMHDPRVCRFFAVDPLTRSYPHYTPYSFSGNKVIHCGELEGLEEIIRIFKLKDGKATLVKVVSNVDIRAIVVKQPWLPKGTISLPVYTFELYDKRTNEKMDPKEIGMEQYQYVDEHGKRLEMRRNHKGEYVKGDNEMMPIYNGNYFGSIYIGPDNPTDIVNGKEITDYRREPQDEVDAAALLHDQDYDKVDAAGFKGAVIDKKTMGADLLLAARATKVVVKAAKNLNDEVTGKKITKNTEKRAGLVSKLFTALAASKTVRKQ